MKMPRLLAASAVLALAAGLGPGLTTAAGAADEPMSLCGGVGNREDTTMPVKVTGLEDGLVKGAPAKNVTVTFENTTPGEIRAGLGTFFALYEADSNPRRLNAGALSVQYQGPDGVWHNGEFGPDPSTNLGVETGTWPLAKGATLTLRIKIAATSKAKATKYGVNIGGAAREGVPFDLEKHICTYYSGHLLNYTFPVVEPAVDPSPKVTPTATPTATSTPTPTPTAATTTQAAPKRPELAETGGGGSALPIALTGAAALVAGGGILLALRRRPNRRSDDNTAD